eukprot:102404_1
MDDFEYVQKVYSSSYRHGFGTDLNDPKFSKYHKLVLNAAHISVNYNRKYVPSDLSDDMDEKEDEKDARELDIARAWSRECNVQQVQAPFECPYIDFIMKELRKFSEINQQISHLNSEKFNELSLSLALDHLTHIHSFCLHETQRMQIKQFIQDSNGQCEDEKHCVALQQFSRRKRETQRRNNREEIHRPHLAIDHSNIQINMLMDTLFSQISFDMFASC